MGAGGGWRPCPRLLSGGGTLEVGYIDFFDEPLGDDCKELLQPFFIR